MTEATAAELFRGSRWFRTGDSFTRADVASYCGVGKERASQIIYDLREEIIKADDKRHGYRVKRTGPNILLQRWRNPLPFDGDYTPRWY